jgi:hypothetical protein
MLIHYPKICKLGRKGIVVDSRTLKLAKYLTTALPSAPSEINWHGTQTAWGMMLNGPDANNPSSAPDGLGDCTIAGAAHAIQVWSKATGKEITVTDAQVLAKYELWDGYVLNDPNTDQGGILLNVLTDWKKSAFYGNKLDAFASVSVSNTAEIKQGVYLFGGLYIGVNLPISAQNQKIWDVVDPSLQGDSAPGSWGGHCIYITGYDQDYLSCITWGSVQLMTWAFWKAYVDEAYCLLGADFINSKTFVNPDGFNLTALKADLALIK